MADPIGIRPLTRAKHIFMGLYGPPDIGKTTFLGNRDKTLILRPPTDHTDSIFDPPPGLREWQLTDHEALAEAMEYLSYDGKKWDWVWFDSATLWQDHGLDDIWQNVIDKRPDRASGPIDKGEYNLNMVRLARFVRHCVGLDAFNFGFTGLVMDAESPEGNLVFMPRVQGKGMSEKFVGYMNLVAYYHWADVKQGGERKRVRRMEFRSTPEFYAKCQFKEAFGPHARLDNPTMAKVEDAIAAARLRAKSPTAAAAKKPAAASARARAAAAAAKRRPTTR